MSGKRISLSAYKKNKALAVAPKKERRLGFGESVSTREVITAVQITLVSKHTSRLVLGNAYRQLSRPHLDLESDDATI